MIQIAEVQSRGPFAQLKPPLALMLLLSIVFFGTGCSLLPKRRVPMADEFYRPPVPEYPAVSERAVSQRLADARQIIPPLADEDGKPEPIRQTGIASWYGGRHHGRLTASGERFDKSDLTAAHCTLPFGSLVKVRNLENEQEVVVRITDRGPFIKNRIIDLSESAAQRIGIFRHGLALVEIEVLDMPGAMRSE